MPSQTSGEIAFVIALWWERSKTKHEAGEASRRAAQQADAAAKAEYERRFTEARRAFHAIVAELTGVRSGLDDAIPKREPGDQHQWWVLPSLATGAWAALAPRLGLIDANFQLIADVAVLNAKVEAVRWALQCVRVRAIPITRGFP